LGFRILNLIWNLFMIMRWVLYIDMGAITKRPPCLSKKGRQIQDGDDKTDIVEKRYTISCIPGGAGYYF